MGYIVCIAEKPSVAKDIANYLGAKTKRNGYYEGNGYKVTWAIGHLVKLCEFESYDAIYEDRSNMDILPFVPQNNEWKTEVIEEVKEQYEIVNNLFWDDETTEIIDCGDAGQEGHYLQWLIRRQTKIEGVKPVKRCLMTSTTEESIKNAFEKLQPIEKYSNICRNGYMRARLDQLIGINISRFLTKATNEYITAGRVQSPTLFLIVNRWLEIKNFMPINYYTVNVTLDKNINVSLGNFKFLGKDSGYLNENGKLISVDIAKKICNEMSVKQFGECVSLETKNKANNRPQLYSLADLQRDANRIYHYKPSEVLASAQRLYEHYKITTYPRTDSNYITEDLKPFMQERIEALLNMDAYKNVAETVLKEGLVLDERIVNSNKVEDHHAIVVTERIKDFVFNTAYEKLEETRKSKCTKYIEIDKNILDMIIKRMLISFSNKYKYKETVLGIKIGDYILENKGIMTVCEGWKATAKALGIITKEDSPEDVENIFGNVQVGEKLKIEKVENTKHTTTPPQLYTIDTLLEKMKNIPLGTSATMGSIIDILFNRKYIEILNKGKSEYLIPTPKGFSVVQVLPNELLSPTISASWEKSFQSMDRGEFSEQDMLDEMKDFLCKEKDVILSADYSKYNFDALRIICSCPLCVQKGRKGDIVAKAIKYKSKDDKTVSTKVYNCTNNRKKPDNGCEFSIMANTLNGLGARSITEEQIIKLCSNGEISIKCKNDKGSYVAVFTYGLNDNGYFGLKIKGFESKKNKKISKKF